MLPLRDLIPSKKTPYVVYAILALNALAFLYEINLGLLHGGQNRQIMSLLYTWGLVPARYGAGTFVQDVFGSKLGLVEQVLPFFTSMFLHGGIWHFVGNMWVLYIFGDNVEDWFGHFWFAVFYIFCGVAAGSAHMFFNWGSTMPTIGASGAIAGVMGAYFILYPHARVLTLIPIFFFIQVIELPAFVFLGFWFLLQFLSGSSGAATSVAWWAHVGGFVVGGAVVILLGGTGMLKRLTSGGKRAQHGRRPPMNKKHSERFDDYWKK